MASMDNPSKKMKIQKIQVEDEFWNISDLSGGESETEQPSTTTPIPPPSQLSSQSSFENRCAMCGKIIPYTNQYCNKTTCFETELEIVTILQQFHKTRFYQQFKLIDYNKFQNAEITARLTALENTVNCLSTINKQMQPQLGFSSCIQVSQSCSCMLENIPIMVHVTYRNQCITIETMLFPLHAEQQQQLEEQEEFEEVPFYVTLNNIHLMLLLEKGKGEKEEAWEVKYSNSTTPAHQSTPLQHIEIINSSKIIPKPALITVLINILCSEYCI